MFKYNWNFYFLLSLFSLFILGLWILFPLAIKNISTVNDILFKKNPLRRIEKIDFEIQNIKASNRNETKQIKEIISNLPRPEKSSKIFAILGRIAQRNKIDIIKITPRPLANDSLFNRLQLNINLTVTFRNLISFLHELESSYYFFRLESLSVKTATKSSYKLIVTLKISAFIQKDEK